MKYTLLQFDIEVGWNRLKMYKMWSCIITSIDLKLNSKNTNFCSLKIEWKYCNYTGLDFNILVR